MAVLSRTSSFRILRLISQGGQGSVFLGYDKRLQRRVAIKVYRLPIGTDLRRRLRREAQLVARIQSHRVVQVYDIIESSSYVALIMEYVPGCSLQDFLSEAHPSLVSILTLGADISEALALAQEKHIIHGDVKAANVLITDCGRAKLIDFGIAKCKGDASSRQWEAGSFSTLSPEQYLGKPLDERIDLFALGCLLYRMLSGEQPFFRNGRPDPNLLLNFSAPSLTDIVGVNTALPDRVVELIDELLEKEPGNRTINMCNVRQTLRSVLQTLSVASSEGLLLEARPYFRCEAPDPIYKRLAYQRLLGGARRGRPRKQ